MRKAILGAAIVAVSATPALAETILTADGRGYIGVEAGLVMPQDVSVSAAASSGGVTVTGSGTYSFDNGQAIGAVAGYRFSDWVTGEAELSYAQFDYDKLTGTVTVSSGGSSASVSGTDDVDGDVSTVLGMLNVLFTPPVDSTGRFRPFVGGGVGFASYEDKIDSIGGASINVSNDDTDLAYQVKLGFDYDVTESFSAGANYTYLQADTGTDYSEDLGAHALFLRGAYRF